MRNSDRNQAFSSTAANHGVAQESCFNKVMPTNGHVAEGDLLEEEKEMLKLR